MNPRTNLFYLVETAHASGRTCIHLSDIQVEIDVPWQNQFIVVGDFKIACDGKTITWTAEPQLWVKRHGNTPVVDIPTGHKPVLMPKTHQYIKNPSVMKFPAFINGCDIRSLNSHIRVYEVVCGNNRVFTANLSDVFDADAEKVFRWEKCPGGPFWAMEFSLVSAYPDELEIAKKFGLSAPKQKNETDEKKAALEAEMANVRCLVTKAWMGFLGETQILDTPAAIMLRYSDFNFSMEAMRRNVSPFVEIQIPNHYNGVLNEAIVQEFLYEMALKYPIELGWEYRASAR